MTHEPRDHQARRPPDHVDAVLRDWRRRQDVAADAAGLARRVAAAIQADATLASPVVRVRPRSQWRERAAWFAAGIAAAVAAVVVLRPGARDDGAADWPPSVRFGADQLAGKAALVAGLEETFSGRLAWVAEHDRRVDVGLTPDETRDGSRPVAVRIVVVSRRVGDAAWTPVWQSDVVTRDEQVVDVAAGPGGTGRLRLWTHALPDGAIAVDGDLALADSDLPLRASYGGVQRPGEPRRVTGASDGGVEWQVIQTVVPLGAPRKDVG
jgi:hypothetical protein